ncbi:MAG: hypothetical protein K5653_03625 [Clostridiales bacterium]|nr:hypothetical protein [Clostridiales bacterium]
MEYMGVIGFVFGIFGFYAYLNMSPLKRKVESLEEALSKMQGTSYHEDRISLLKAAETYIGEKVKIDFKEDHEDFDISYYGNSKYGANIIMEADRDWMLVHVETPKGSKDKLIRMESIQRITKVD